VTLEHCLAHAVLKDHVSWLGAPSPRGLSTLLAGAYARAEFTGGSLPLWRIYGPLETPEFYLPLVKRTGFPELEIKACTAVELLHFSLTDAMTELLTLVETWHSERGFDLATTVADERFEGRTIANEAAFWELFSKRPGMFLGSVSGTDLQFYLTGMDRGGDWLGLPKLPQLRVVVDRIHRFSVEHYGSPFAAFRVYHANATPLLVEAGLTEV
jgi:hypothetical protein